MHGYSYANGSPVSNSDPTGLKSYGFGSLGDDTPDTVICLGTCSPGRPGGSLARPNTRPTGDCDCEEPVMTLGRTLDEKEYKDLKQAGYKGTQLFTLNEAVDYMSAGVTQYSYACAAIFYAAAPHECQQAAYDFFDPPGEPFEAFKQCWNVDLSSCGTAFVQTVVIVASFRFPATKGGGRPPVAPGGVAVRADFASIKSMNEHYAKHVHGVKVGKNGKQTAVKDGGDMPEFRGPNGRQQYHDAARSFMSGAGPQGSVSLPSSSGGMFRVDPKTGYFGYMNASGTISTFYRPRGDVMQYFWKQFK